MSAVASPPSEWLLHESMLTSASIAAHPTSKILAVVLPDLLNELVLRGELGLPGGSALRNAPAKPLQQRQTRAAVCVSVQMQRQPGLTKREPPRAVVLTEPGQPPWGANTELDAVNSVAYGLGVRPHQSIAQASAIVDKLQVHALPRASVVSALQQIAEMALGFGSPVSFQAPDTVWVDISGSSHLFGTERELALEFAAQIRALGHSSRIAVASGPWLSRAFAQHACLEESGILVVEPSQAARAVGQLPIMALPIPRETVSWFSRLGLLNIEDLRRLPPGALAARLEGPPLEGQSNVLELIHGKDDGLLIPHHPEEMPSEELFWEEPLESIEPLLFVLKGLSSRLSARLEGRRQAARELLLTIHYDRYHYDRNSSALHTGSEPQRVAGAALHEPIRTQALCFKLASPLFHAEDLERVVRSRLQRQNLAAPALGLNLQATSVTEADYLQLGFSPQSRSPAADPRSLAVLVAELASDIGAEAVGLLSTQESHLLEKSSRLSRVQNPVPPRSHIIREARAEEPDPALNADPGNPRFLPRFPTRLLDPPIEVHAPLRENELWVIHEQAFVIRSIEFDERIESVEWWSSARISRDYFRVWLVATAMDLPISTSRDLPLAEGALRGRMDRNWMDRSGMEALVYRDRETRKNYLHALFD